MMWEVAFASSQMRPNSVGAHKKPVPAAPVLRLKWRRRIGAVAACGTIFHSENDRHLVCSEEKSEPDPAMKSNAKLD